MFAPFKYLQSLKTVCVLGGGGVNERESIMRIGFCVNSFSHVHSCSQHSTLESAGLSGAGTHTQKHTNILCHCAQRSTVSFGSPS